MKQKQLHKSVLLFLLACSFCSFLFVNIHAAVSTAEQASTSLPETTLPQQQQPTCADKDEETAQRKIDAVFLLRVVEAVGRLASLRN